ncbi:MAG TPA: hypothetical protein VK805_02445 [Candidatus Baltobacteraceae bacterium]|nr:hypothetical protein [Candidatus Baltobacteraceae bacterium]
MVTAIYLAVFMACSSQQPSASGYEEKTQRPENRQTTPDAKPHAGMEFKLLRMTNGVNGAGKTWGGKIYETPTHTKVQLTIVHLDSRESAKKEYDDNLKAAIRIIKQEKVQDKPATKPATTEDRAEVIVSAARECKEATSILATAGTVLRIITSCSSEAAIEFESRQTAVRVRMTKTLFGKQRIGGRVQIYANRKRITDRREQACGEAAADN